MKRLKISEIHVIFSDSKEGALWGAFVFLKRLMFIFFSSCAFLVKSETCKVFTATKDWFRNSHPPAYVFHV